VTVQEDRISRTEEIRTLIRDRRLDAAKSKCEALCRHYPGDAESWFLLGSLAGQAGDLSRATDCFHKATDLDPQHAGALLNLGRALDRSENYEEAETVLRRALELRPQDPSIYFLLGRALHLQNKYDEAIAMYSQAVRLDPNHFNAHYNLGRIYQSRGDFSNAERSYRGAVNADPRNANAYGHLGHTLLLENKLEEAEVFLAKALTLDPQSVRTCHDFGLLRTLQKRYTDAKKYLELTIEKDPKNWAVLSDLGLLYKNMGYIDEAIHSFKRSIAMRPTSVLAHQNLCLTLNYKNDIDGDELYSAHLKTAGLYEHPVEKVHFSNIRTTVKRLKVGYVSGDFGAHPVAYFIETLFKYHDRAQVEVTAYSNVKFEDKTTEWLRSLVDGWVPIAGMNDEQVVQRVRSDGIDILVDLSGHTGRNRLGIFARRAAPVQVTYLGYPNTTGLKEMDYRLTDHRADPLELHPDDFYSEELVRLPHCFTCYTPPRNAPEVNSLPALSNDYVTFGSLNNFPKINDGVIALWSEILTQVAGSRMVLQASAFSDKGVRIRVEQEFGRYGIDAGRLVLKTLCPFTKHLAIYGGIDIGLDPFPWNGHTTTCHALWMGVPVVALAGRRHASRMSLSVLSNLSLSDWIARDEQAYVDTAVERASHLDDLQELRSTMRDRLLHSSLCDEVTFARDVEQAYRRMWRRWCARER